ncbi:MAG TPA: 50S ribosomal protein L10 [Terriglobia bacterium]|jgi:large subunit ribosomal protein L10|nr:50S ribosomal protein L10 [Terriglobia bacterium]
MNRDEKNKEIEALSVEFKAAKNLFVAGFQGLTVSQDSELRRSVRASGSKYKVVKNTLAQRACKDTVVELLKDIFAGANAVVYNEKDPVALVKALTTYAKNNPLFVFKAGIIEGRVINLADLDQIADLPSKEELISKLMFLVKAQAQRLASAMSAVPRNLAVVLNQASEQKKFKE